MKRASVIGVLVVLVIGAATWTSFASMGFRVYGGYSMLSPSDYNDYLETYLVDDYGGEIVTLNKLSSAIPFGADFRYETESGLIFSLGFTRFSGTAGFTWEDVLWAEEMEREDTITVMGGLGSVLYAVGSSSFRFYFGGGAGYYAATLEKTVPVEVMWWRDEFEYTAKKSQLGFHGMGGFEYSLAENIALGVELLYRVLNIPEWTITEHDDPAMVDETWEQEMDLSGISILFGLNIYT